ncbi:hypothetical protein HY992_04325 [Candidatus Micrarchaeota archaeon]|nr:hypothetical protein [Candidatus Micrarchaeota archaeon]
MGLLDMFGKKDVSDELGKTPYSVKARFNPIRLAVKKGERVDLYIDVKNLRSEQLMTSLVLKVPKQLGFDATGINDTREMRLGFLKPGEDRSLIVQVYENARTEPGDYDVTITAYCHYRDYAHYLSSVAKTLTLRAVKG